MSIFVSALPGVPVLLWNLLDADLQGVQHGTSHGPHLCVSPRCCTGLSGHHHPAAGRCTAGTAGSAGESPGMLTGDRNKKNPLESIISYLLLYFSDKGGKDGSFETFMISHLCLYLGMILAQPCTAARLHRFQLWNLAHPPLFSVFSRSQNFRGF